ncbi:MAG TPA: ABC transporter permease [Terriglobales bacterium]|nr:ABC transporter permease [Terriglobales bacterium]
MTAFLQDLRFGWRLMRQAKSVTLIAVLSLAIGIGANTAIFSVVNAVVLNPLPYHDSDRLVSLFQDRQGFHTASISYMNFLDWQRMNRSFAAMAAYRSTGYSLLGRGEPERLHGEMISAGFFEILGVNPLLGRPFTADEDHLGANPTAMISERLWRRKFGADPNIIGQRMILDDVGRTIIGVVPSTFDLKIQNFQEELLNEVYTPIGEFSDPRFRNRASGWGTDAIGRLQPAISFEQARTDLERVAHELAAAYPDVNSSTGITMIALREEMVGQVRGILLILLGAVGFVLLIACVNVANLLLARSNSRQREFAVRVALGASPGRIVRQLLSESILLALAGGVFGLLLASWGTRAALALVPQSLPRAEEISIDPRVLLFTFAISVTAGILFGLAPAWKASSHTADSTLRESGRSLARSHSRAQGVFVVVETALALVLLVGAGLMLRTLFRLWSSDPGFNPHNLITFSTAAREELKQRSPEAIRAYYREMHDRIAATPGVDSVSSEGGSQPMQSDDENWFWILGTPKPEHFADLPWSIMYSVEPEYLKVMQIPLKRGRFITPQDTEHSQPVVVIDESFAQKYFAGRDPIGQHVDFDPSGTGPDKQPAAEIVGIVGHVNQWGLDHDGAGALHTEAYFPYRQNDDKSVVATARFNTVYVRTRQPGVPSLETLRQRLLEFDSGLVLYDASTMDRVLADSIAAKRFSMTLLAAFAAIALLLAAVGIYGVVSYLVGQRTREIGVRIALGARPLDVLRMVLADGARMTLLGICIGLLAALGLTRLMASMLFGVKPTDPLTFALVAVLLGAIALLACFVPAQRAMRIDPMVALRYE